jgi:hypothetical protein
MPRTVLDNGFVILSVRYIVPKKPDGSLYHQRRVPKGLEGPAGELLKLFDAHDVANCDFANTIFAAYGIASPAGRIIDRTLNSCAGMYLDFDLRGLGERTGFWCFDERPCDGNGSRIKSPPSAAAQRIADHALHRQNGRKVPFTPYARAARLAYAAEKCLLLRRIELLFESAKKVVRSDSPRRWVRCVAKERQYAERLCAILATEAVAA